MIKKLTSIRGATQSLNTKEDIQKNVCDLCNKIFEENKLKTRNIVNIQFTVTKDITALNPATALRLGKTNFDSSKVALFCSQECEIDKMLPTMIRVMVTTYMSPFLKKTNVYINGAENLRPDLAGK